MTVTDGLAPWNLAIQAVWAELADEAPLPEMVPSRLDVADAESPEAAAEALSVVPSFAAQADRRRAAERPSAAVRRIFIRELPSKTGVEAFRPDGRGSARVPEMDGREAK